ncbi:acylphosphatase-1-like [Agrilus planipennis]|uniref:Acylphosphatase n=1 Tax=Agrilus planipennis TaxID=224129 RepID=A0A1W4X3Y5_AGRPL|nr:acylphosphatase-1-like [Agrilus planipennis]
MAVKRTQNKSITGDLKSSLHPKLEDDETLLAVDFEVFGKVQGVFFRKHTMLECRKLGVKGWVMNTPKGTVIGVLEGEEEKIQRMLYWLQFKGSPKSIIEKTKFSNKREIPKLTFTDFTIRK